MGHVTIVHENLNEARTIAEEVKKKIRVIAWFENEMIWKFENKYTRIIIFIQNQNLILEYAAWGIVAASLLCKLETIEGKIF
jgi:hypothetical protein